MGKWKESICGWMGTICNCVSVAVRQAREAEIDIVSKRRFRQMLASGEASFALPQEEGTGMREVLARMGARIDSFLHGLDDVKNQAEQIIIGGKLPEIARVGPGRTARNDIEPDVEDSP